MRTEHVLSALDQLTAMLLPLYSCYSSSPTVNSTWYPVLTHDVFDELVTGYLLSLLDNQLARTVYTSI